jgi:hypothetical protein
VSWSASVPLQSGSNTVTFVGHDAATNASSGTSRAWTYQPAALPGTVFYVSPSGNDAVSCSTAQNSGSPLRHIANGIACLTSGNSLSIAAGVYDELNLIPPANTTISGAGIGVTIIRPTSGAKTPCFEVDANGVTIQQLTCDGVNQIFTIGIAVFGQQALIQDVEVSFATDDGLISTCTSGQPPGCGVGNNTFRRVHAHHAGMGSAGCAGSDCNGVDATSDSNLVDGGEFDHNHDFGIQNYGLNNTIRNTIMHENGGGGITVPGTVIAYNNVMWGNNPGGGSATVWDQCTGASIYYSLTIVNNGGIGMNLPCANGSKFINSITVGNGTNIQVSNPGSVTTSNNITSGSVAFVDAAHNNYALSQSANNAIDQGMTLGSPYNVDILGVSRPQPPGGAYDIGAYEFQSGGGTTPPTVNIQQPVFVASGGSGTTSTSTSPLTTLSGQASATSPATVSSVTWSCPGCASGSQSGTANGTTTWNVPSIGLTSGSNNAITVTVTDSNSNTATATLTVTYTPAANPPTVTIRQPTAVASGGTGSFPTNTTPLATLSGDASAVAPATVASVAWACSTCSPTSRTATGTTSWSDTNIGLAVGSNSITVTVTDSASAQAHATLTVTYTPVTPPPSGTVQFQPLPPVVVGHPLLRGLRGWWRGLPGYTGSLNVYDLMGFTLGTLVGMGTGMSPTQGWGGSTRPGGYMQLNFDGVAAQVNFGTPSTIADLPQKTVCLWMNPIDYDASGTSQMLNKFENGGWVLYFDNANGVGLVVDFAGTAFGEWRAGSVVPLGVWSHHCVTYDATSASNVPNFYRNGFFAGPVTTVTAPTGTVASDATSPLYLGSNPSGSTASHGAYDDVRIWNRLLSGKEIWEIYSRSRQGDPGLLAVPGTQAVAVPVAAVPLPGHPGFLPFFRPPHLHR